MVLFNLISTAPKANLFPSIPKYRQCPVLIGLSKHHLLSQFEAVFSRILSNFDNYFCDNPSFFGGAKRRQNFLITNRVPKIRLIRSKYADTCFTKSIYRNSDF